VLLQKFATKQKVDRFKQTIHRPAIGVSPIPLHPSKRDFVLLAAGIPPFHYHNHVQRVTTKEHGLAVYLDVSGSVNDHLPRIVGILHSLKAELTSIFLFSNKVVEVPLKALLAGRVQTTYGTDFDCIAQSIVERGLDKAVILTDGYASLRAENSERLKQRRTCTLTVLFGGKTECEEFAPFGDVVQLADITE
jgi:predicted metal-dependent peptidase